MNNSENFVLNEESSNFKIFAKTFKIAQKNIVSITILVLLCFALMWATSYLFRFATYSPEGQTIDMNQYYQKFILGLLINFLQILIKFFIFLSLLRIIDKDEKYLQALRSTAKMILPIIFSETLVLLLIGFIPTIVVSFPLILAFIPIKISIALIIVALALIIFLIFLFLRVVFSAAITLLEEMKYFKTVKISWRLTQGNTRALAWKLFVPIFIYFTFVYTMSVILPLYFNIVIGSYAIIQKALDLIAPPIFIIYYYNIYTIYRDKYVG